MGNIKKSLGLSESDRIDFKRGGGVEVAGRSIGRNIPLEAWADGYRKTFTWILDLYAWAMRANAITKTGNIRGILLVDELEQHLHPSMQASLCSMLRELLPDVQLLLTTHSPLVVLGANAEEIIALKRHGRTIVAEKDYPNFTAYSAEDVLSDKELFDTGVYSPRINKKLERYHNLVSAPKHRLKPAERKELKTLARELGAQQLVEPNRSSVVREIQKLRKDLDI